MYLINGNKGSCFGCGACVNVCPTRCIFLETDNEGFGYPIVDEARCIHCDACLRVCPFDKKTNLLLDRLDEPMIRGARHKDDEVRTRSSSGGVFTALSDEILCAGGAVYGAIFNAPTLSVQHIRAVNPTDRQGLLGSKYVQSDLQNVFNEAKADLDSGQNVLFSGTPCQVAGLLEFLKKDYENLLTVDFICHGVPSPKVFKDYLLFVSGGSPIVDVSFREKSLGWRTACMKISFEDKGPYRKKWTRDPFYSLFFKDLVLRPSCYECRYSTLDRTSDITMGDFWGIENTHPYFDDNTGVSFLLINSVKGRTLFETAESELHCILANVSDAKQPNLKSPTVEPSTREQFWNDYQSLPFGKIIKKYADYGFVGRTKLYCRVGIPMVKKKAKDIMSLVIQQGGSEHGESS